MTKAEEFQWGKELWPLVTTCCGSFNWVCVMAEKGPGGGDYCHNCNKLTTVALVTVDQYNKNLGRNYTAEQFTEMWELRGN